MFTRAGRWISWEGKTTFLSGQDDFFQTANQPISPISVRHLSQPYNKIFYCLGTQSQRKYFAQVHTLKAFTIKNLITAKQDVYEIKKVQYKFQRSYAQLTLSLLIASFFDDLHLFYTQSWTTCLMTYKCM